MIIDAHQHLWDPARRRYPFLEEPALAPIRRPYTVDDLREVTDGRVTEIVSGLQEGDSVVAVNIPPSLIQSSNGANPAQQLFRLGGGGGGGFRGGGGGGGGGARAGD